MSAPLNLASLVADPASPGRASCSSCHIYHVFEHLCTPLSRIERLAYNGDAIRSNGTRLHPSTAQSSCQLICSIWRRSSWPAHGSVNKVYVHHQQVIGTRTKQPEHLTGHLLQGGVEYDTRHMEAWPVHSTWHARRADTARQRASLTA